MCLRRYTLRNTWNLETVRVCSLSDLCAGGKVRAETFTPCPQTKHVP